MNKEFVTYNPALALKELGFDEPCFGYYDTVAVTYLTYPSAINKNSDIENSLSISKQDKNVRCSAPTYSQAFRWFREKYRLSGFIFSYNNTWNWKIDLINVSSEDYSKDIKYDTYEEAESACLDKLIEIARLPKP